MRIILFLPSLGRGGAEKVFVNLANEWSLKHDVTLITQYENEFYSDQLNFSVNRVRISTNKLLALFDLIKLIDTIRPKFVLSTLNVPNILNFAASLFTRSRYLVVTRQAEQLQNYCNFGGKIIKYLLRLSFKYSGLIICNSRSTKESLIVSGFVKHKRVVTIQNPVISENINELANEDYVVPSFLIEKRFILSVGRLEKVKNFELLIKSYALSQLSNLCYLVIIGEGTLRSNLESLIDSLGLNGRVLLLGSQNNPFPFYKFASLFVSTSLWEGFGNVFIEAMAFNLPIIATSTGSAPELLGNGKYGYILKSFSETELSKLLSDFFYNMKSIEPIDKHELEKYRVSYVSGLYLNRILNF
ncbi:glycosyltransferase [Algoriphagus sediminis]|uniref:Glycosyltransferase n=1 Tax=Algoriphagus sediminis TaxID=3057113 RepID=A0ABT7YDV8_9BACT|nr:glycosyltransferase [Algoriphagus sediminis]MDN3204672.1 glycosyltransferase [Algoriphagus sediminis]